MQNKGDVKSPCVGICKLDADSICIGCFRSSDEIASWGILSDADKQQILGQCKERAWKIMSGE